MGGSVSASKALAYLAGVVGLIVANIVCAIAIKALNDPSSAGSKSAFRADAIAASATGPHDSFDAIGGYEAVKKTLRQLVVLPMKHSEVFYTPNAPSLRPPSAILLAGPPGTGKTSLVRACAQESGATLIPLHSANLESKWFGETPKILASAFRSAQERAPSIVFFDEIDSLGRTRSAMEHDATYALKCELLRQLDDVARSNSPVIVVGCTNCANLLDPALKRRFGRTVVVPLPDEKEREAVLRVLTSGESSPLSPHALSALARRSEGFSGAALKSAHSEACANRFWRRYGAREDFNAGKSSSEIATELGPLRSADWPEAMRPAARTRATAAEA